MFHVFGMKQEAVYIISFDRKLETEVVLEADIQNVKPLNPEKLGRHHGWHTG